MKVRRLLVVVPSFAAVLFLAIWGGPIVSGAIRLIAPTGIPPHPHDLPDSYTPRHKGGIDLGTGLYTREDEDLVVPGTPGLILRRTYLSRDRKSRHFGVGTTHNGELYLIGDPVRFQWVELILANGGRIRFERTSWGTSYLNAVFEHHETPTKWLGARLGWVGSAWALRLRDGTVMQFMACSPLIKSVCALIEERDPDGHTVSYRRDRSGRLLRIEAAPDRWIAFEYDAKNRIARASDSRQHAVRYEYDDRGRLSLVTANNGEQRRYEYTDLDEMATIAEPDTTIENTYEDGRCVRQVNRWPDESQPYTFRFAYTLTDHRITQTDTTASDGTWTRYRFNGSGYPVLEAWGEEGRQPTSFEYERQAITNRVTSITLTCPDRGGTLIRRSSRVGKADEDSVKLDLLRTNCSSESRYN